MEQGYGEEPPANDQHRVSDIRGAARDDQVNDEQKAASAPDDQRSTDLSKPHFGHVCSGDAAVVLDLRSRVRRRGIATVIAMPHTSAPKAFPHGVASWSTPGRSRIDPTSARARVRRVGASNNAGCRRSEITTNRDGHSPPKVTLREMNAT